MDALSILVETAFQRGFEKALEIHGKASGEISQNKAIKTFGKWFVDAEKDGRIRPIRIGEGRNGTRTYRLDDILSLKAVDAAKAMLKF